MTNERLTELLKNAMRKYCSFTQAEYWCDDDGCCSCLSSLGLTEQEIKELGWYE